MSEAKNWRVETTPVLRLTDDKGVVRFEGNDPADALQLLAFVMMTRDTAPAAATPAPAGEAGHVLYTSRDADRPESICDSNGEVVLQLCRKCGKGEIELDGPCAAPARQDGAGFMGLE